MNEYKKIRLKLGMSIGAIARELNINRTTWRRYERGECVPKDQMRYDIDNLVKKRELD